MGLTDYSSMESEIRNAPEPKVLPKGKEVKARIVSVSSGNSEKYGGALWHNVTFDVPSDPTIREFKMFQWDPVDRDRVIAVDAQQWSRALDQFNKFTKCFGIDLSKPFDWESDLPGKTGWVIGGNPTSDDYGDKGTIGKFVVSPPAAGGKAAAGTSDDIPF